MSHAGLVYEDPYGGSAAAIGGGAAASLSTLTTNATDSGGASGPSDPAGSASGPSLVYGASRQSVSPTLHLSAVSGGVGLPQSQPQHLPSQSQPHPVAFGASGRASPPPPSQQLEHLRYTYRPSKRSQTESLLPPLVDNLLLPPNSSINQSTHFNWNKGIITEPVAGASANAATGHPTAIARSDFAYSGSSPQLLTPTAGHAGGAPGIYGGYEYAAASPFPHGPFEAAPGFLAPPPMMQPQFAAFQRSAQSQPEMEDAQNILKRRKRQRHPEKWKRNNYVRKVLKDKGACSCTRQCFDLVPASERELIKKEFAQFSKTQQDAHLLSLISIEEKRTAAATTPAVAATATTTTTTTTATATTPDVMSTAGSASPATKPLTSASSISDLANAASALSGGLSPAVAPVKDEASVARRTADGGTSSAAESDGDSSDTDADNRSKATLGSKASGNSKRSPKLFNSKYFVRVRDDGPFDPALQHQQAPPGFRLVRVCHYAFLSIHGIGKKRVNNLVSHAFASKNHLAPRHDLRGRHNNRANRVSEDVVVLAEAHVKSFPRYGVIDVSSIWTAKRQELRRKRDARKKKAQGGLDVSNDTASEERKENDVTGTSSPTAATPASEGAATVPAPPPPSSGTAAAPSSARSGSGPLSASSLLHRPPPRYLSPHLSLVKMYRLFISQYQPVLLEIEKHQPRLARIDRGKATAARIKDEVNAATAANVNSPVPAGTPTGSSGGPSQMSVEESVPVTDASMPPPPARRPSSVALSMLERTPSLSNLSGADRDDASPQPRADGASSASVAGSTSGGPPSFGPMSNNLNSNQLASVFSVIQCNQCKQATGTIPVLWRQHFAVGSAGSSGGSVAASSRRNSVATMPVAGKGAKRRRSTVDGATAEADFDDDEEDDAASVSTRGRGTASTRNSAANSLSNSSILGLFCTSECTAAFLERISSTLPGAVPVGPFPTSESSAASDSTRICVPFAHWRDLPHLGQSEKLLKPLVSRDKYERLFRGLNLRFGSGRIDSCPACNDFALKMEAGESASGVSRAEVQDQWNAHLIRGKKASDMLEHDKKMSLRSWSAFHTAHAQMHAQAASGAMSSPLLNSQFAIGTVDTLEVGFQPNRPLPQYTSLVGSGGVDHSYKRSLWVYLYGIHSAATQQTSAFMWDERTGRRKVNEIISCLWKYIHQASDAKNEAALTHPSVGSHVVPTSTPTRAPWLILLGEGFRNFWSICFLSEICRDDGTGGGGSISDLRSVDATTGEEGGVGVAITEVPMSSSSSSSASSLFRYRRIDYKILEGGHTPLEADKILAPVDREGRTFPIFKPNDWLDAVRSLTSTKRPATAAGSSTAATAAAVGAAPSKNQKVTPMWLGREAIFDWKSYLRQSYSRELSTKTITGEDVDFSKVVWFNFGVGNDNPPAPAPGAPPPPPNTTGLPALAYHPDEVWVRYTMNINELWKKIRLRRPDAPTDITAETAVHRLYSSDEQPLPISHRKAQDLYDLRRFIPPQYHSFYPPPTAIEQEEDQAGADADNETEYEEEVEEEDLFLPPSAPVQVPIVPSAAPTGPTPTPNPPFAGPGQMMPTTPAATMIPPYSTAPVMLTQANFGSPYVPAQTKLMQPQQTMPIGGQFLYSHQTHPAAQINYAQQQQQPQQHHHQQQQHQQQQHQASQFAHQSHQQHLHQQLHGASPVPASGHNSQPMPNVGHPLGALPPNFPPTAAPPSSASYSSQSNLAGPPPTGLYVNGLGHMDLHTLQAMSRLPQHTAQQVGLMPPTYMPPHGYQQINPNSQGNMMGNQYANGNLPTYQQQQQTHQQQPQQQQQPQHQMQQQQAQQQQQQQQQQQHVQAQHQQQQQQQQQQAHLRANQQQQQQQHHAMAMRHQQQLQQQLQILQQQVQHQQQQQSQQVPSAMNIYAPNNYSMQPTQPTHQYPHHMQTPNPIDEMAGNLHLGQAGASYPSGDYPLGAPTRVSTLPPLSGPSAAHFPLASPIMQDESVAPTGQAPITPPLAMQSGEHADNHPLQYA